MKTREEYISLVDEAAAAGARREEACKLLGVRLRTLQRWRNDSRDDGRKNNRFPVKNALSPEEIHHLIATACSPEFRDKSPRQIVPILAERGIYIASESTFYRVLRKFGLLKHRSNAKAPQRNKPEEYQATGPNQIWTWDISYLLSFEKGVFHYLYLITDIWDRSIVGWLIAEEQSGKLAEGLFREACLRENISPKQLVVHQDNGGPMTSVEFLALLNSWEILPSYSRPGICDDNAFSESLFRTLKYRPSYPGKFKTIEDAREWMQGFVEWYHNEHRHSGIKFITPMQRREGKDKEILKIRKETYEKAKALHPERWSGDIRNWDRIDEVVLNPKSPKTERRSGQKNVA